MEQKTTVQDETGYRLYQEEVKVNQIGLKWGTYTNTIEKVLSFHPQKASIVSHYRLVNEPDNLQLREKHFVVFREPASCYELILTPTTKTREYFELALDESLFNELVTPENDFLLHFQQHLAVETPAYDFTAAMTPVMQTIIREMQQAPFAGRLKEAYLEAKAIELFLLQVRQLDHKTSVSRSKLSAADTERLYFIREEMTVHYSEPWSIVLLARKAGINQTKLKAGFLELFGTTVFGYLTDIRMQEARRLLVDEKLYVGEVAERMGYQQPHHFTAAFKRKFGVLPKKIRQ